MKKMFLIVCLVVTAMVATNITSNAEFLPQTYENGLRDGDAYARNVAESLRSRYNTYGYIDPMGYFLYPHFSYTNYIYGIRSKPEIKDIIAILKAESTTSPYALGRYEAFYAFYYPPTPPPSGGGGWNPEPDPEGPVTGWDDTYHPGPPLP